MEERSGRTPVRAAGAGAVDVLETRLPVYISANTRCNRDEERLFSVIVQNAWPITGPISHVETLRMPLSDGKASLLAESAQPAGYETLIYDPKR